MKRFVQGQERSQGTLFPACLDEYISDDNPVRVIDVFVEFLDLHALGFDGVVPHATGHPAYHPAALLKIYIYGYLNRIPASRRLEQVEASIAHYLSALDKADRQESALAQEKSGRIKDKIAAFREQMQQFRELEQQVLAAPDQQISLTDPDARSMATSGKGTGIVGYNVQMAVEAEHHLIVAHEVTTSPGCDGV
jgi:hypothetical protein